MEVELPHYYLHNSNCHDIHYSYIPLSSKHDLIRYKICKRSQENFNLIWKGKDKVKRLVNDIEDGELKAPHLDSIIKTQRIFCCKRLASEQPSSWKTILLHYLKSV